MKNKKYNKDNIIGILICIFLIILVIVLNFVFLYKKNEKETYNVRVYRTIDEINKSDVIYLDNEAIALFDSVNDTSLRAEAIKVCGLINEIRTDNNLGTLTWNSNLEDVANVRAKEISETFSHTRPNGKDWYTVNSKIQGGENLAFGYDTADEAIQAWMDSPTHRENILYPVFKTMAVSIYEKDGTFYWSQEYGY